MSNLSHNHQLNRHQRRRLNRMSRILSANGSPVGASPTIARPGETRVDVTPHLTPQGVILAISVEGQPPMGIPMSPEVAIQVGVGLIAKAGGFMTEQERAMRERVGTGSVTSATNGLSDDPFVERSA